MFTAMTPEAFTVVDADIDSLRHALDAGRITSVELVARYLNRIAAYDRSGIRLNSVPVLDPRAFAAARASDLRRAQGQTLGPLDGIPFTAKDSYRVEGLPVASGSPPSATSSRATTPSPSSGCAKPAPCSWAHQHASHGRRRHAARGIRPRRIALQRGLPGIRLRLRLVQRIGHRHRGELLRLRTRRRDLVVGSRARLAQRPGGVHALARDDLGTRQLALVPTMDVVVPHTRSVADLQLVLDAVVVDDAETEGDLWRTQPFIDLPRPSEVRPESFAALEPLPLAGLRLAVPRIYVNGDPDNASPIVTRDSVMALWNDLRADLEAAGAEVVETAFPVVERYEKLHAGDEDFLDRGFVTRTFLDDEVGDLAVWAMDTFLRTNADPRLPRLADAEAALIFPHPPGALPDRYGIWHYDISYDIGEYVDRAQQWNPDWRDVPSLEEGLRGLEHTRRVDFEEWMQAEGIDAVVFPTQSDVGPADADVNPASADIAWRNGVWVSNGNLVPRHLGIPTVTVPMGTMADTRMPVGLTLAGPAYSDTRLVQLAQAIAALGERRMTPPRTPALPDEALFADPRPAAEGDLSVTVDDVVRDGERVSVTATVAGGTAVDVALFVDGARVPAQLENGRVTAQIALEPSGGPVSAWVAPTARWSWSSCAMPVAPSPAPSPRHPPLPCDTRITRGKHRDRDRSDPRLRLLQPGRPAHSDALRRRGAAPVRRHVRRRDRRAGARQSAGSELPRLRAGFGRAARRAQAQQSGLQRGRDRDAGCRGGSRRRAEPPRAHPAHRRGAARRDVDVVGVEPRPHPRARDREHRRPHAHGIGLPLPRRRRGDGRPVGSGEPFARRLHPSRERAGAAVGPPPRGRVIDTLLPLEPDAEVRAIVQRAADAARAALAPVQAALPVQAGHFDVTDDNVLRAPDAMVPDAVIDFGDVCASWRVGEIAVTVSSVLHHDGASPETAFPAIRAFDRVRDLSDDELTALWPLVILRGAVLVLSGRAQVRLDDENEYASVALDREFRILEQAASVPIPVITAATRAALGRSRAEEPAWTGAPVLSPGRHVELDASTESPLNDEGAWLDAFTLDDAALAALDAGADVVTVPAWRARLTGTTDPLPSTPETVPTDVLVWLAETATLDAGAGGTLAIDGVPEGTASGILPARTRVSIRRTLDDVVPPLRTTRALADAWREVWGDPGAALGIPSATPETDDVLERRHEVLAEVQEHYYATPRASSADGESTSSTSTVACTSTW